MVLNKNSVQKKSSALKEYSSRILPELASLSAEVVTVSIKSIKSIALIEARCKVATAIAVTSKTDTDQVVMTIAMTLMMDMDKVAKMVMAIAKTLTTDTAIAMTLTTDTVQVARARAVTSEACLSTLAVLFKENLKIFLTIISLESTSNLETAVTVSTTSKKLTALTT